MSQQAVSGESRSGVFTLPSSSGGRLCAGLLVVVVVAVALNNMGLMPFTESRSGLDTIQAVINAVIGLIILAVGASGMWSVIRQRERSWIVILAISLTLLVIAFNIFGD